MSTFDAKNLLEVAFTQSNDTKLIPTPEGEYMAVIEAIDIKSGVSQKNNEPWARLDCSVAIDDPQVESQIGRKPKIRAGVMLDILESGGLDLGKGRNVQLGRLREATGKNQEGVPFRFQDLIGQIVKVKVSHRPDPKDPAVIYDEVKAFLKP